MNKKIIKRKINFMKDPLKNYLMKSNHKRAIRFARYYETSQIDQNSIMYESRDGNSLTDSPFAIFRYLLSKPEFSHYQHIWSIENFEILSSVMKQYSQFSNVIFVKRNSKKYLKYLTTSKYLINNSTFQSFFIPKPEQVYINTWHGTPLKYMGFDIPGNPSHSQNVLRNFLSSSFLISPNAHTTKMFTDSYKLKGLYKGEIIEDGYPRIDLTLKTSRSEYMSKLSDIGVELNNKKKNILYAPTWKGNNVAKVNNDVLQIKADIQQLKKEVGNQYNVLVKVHPYLFKEASKHTDLSSNLIPDYCDTNELLSIVDLLITDYSSIFFDFLVTEKPILFYTWDNDAYASERGQYLSAEELPGPLLFNISELIGAIINIDRVENEFTLKYAEAKSRFTKYDDGNVTERLVNYIFKGRKNQLNIINDLGLNKEKILIYPGGMRDNGITSSFINLMNNIDYNKYDVSCFTGTPHNKEAIKNISKVNKNVRFIFKPGLPIYKLSEVYKDKYIHNRGEKGWLGKSLYPEDAYRREFKRLFGNIDFDYVIDFSGYSLFWAKFLVASEAKRKICFMHNDLLSDSEKIVNNRRPHRINLKGLFTIYNRFDKLVSVSKGTMELNRKNLSNYAEFDKFDYVLNSINPDKILNMSTPEIIDNGDNRLSEKFISRAQLMGGSFWNLLPVELNSKEYHLPLELNNAEVLITRKAIINENTYYKINYNNQVVGWINSDNVSLMEDSIIEEKAVNRIGVINKTHGNHIWSKPYKVKGIKKVSGSQEYKNLFVNINKSALTQHGEYVSFSISGTHIGWIDSSAIQIHDRYSIDSTTSKIKELQIKIRRRLLLRRNYKMHQLFINNLKNRVLEEINVNFYAKLSFPENHIIWSKAFPSTGSKKVLKASDLKDVIVKVQRIHKTRKGKYYEIILDKEHIGWIDARAFEKVDNKPVIIKQTKVSKTAAIKLREKDYIWQKPYGLMNNEKIDIAYADLENKIVRIDKEVTTQKGTFSHISLNGVALGWLDNHALIVKEYHGFIINGDFIPEPSEENINFVNMGRLSPEKGQDNLIHAFAQFHNKNKNSKLYILGKGALYDDLKSLIRELQLEDSVYLLGQIENPFNFIKKCSCFVLSSHYEGQPMVLLEAMTLGMKIIATDIIANRTVLENGKYGLLVENSITGIEKGLWSILNKEDGTVPYKFNYQKYNDLAMESFYKCL